MSDATRLSQLQSMLQENPTDSFLLFAVAKEYQNLNKLDLAIKYFEQLRASDSDYVGLYYHLAQTYIDAEQNDQAIAIYNEGIATAQKLKDQHALAELQNAKLNFEMEL